MLILFSLISFIQQRGLLVTTLVSSLRVTISDDRPQWFILVELLSRIWHAVAFRCRCACIHPGHPTSRTHDRSMTTSTVKGKRKKRGREWSSWTGIQARVVLQLGSVYNSADYISAREWSRHCWWSRESSRTMNLSIVRLGSRTSLPLTRVEQSR